MSDVRDISHEIYKSFDGFGGTEDLGKLLKTLKENEKIKDFIYKWTSVKENDKEVKEENENSESSSVFEKVCEISLLGDSIKIGGGVSLSYERSASLDVTIGGEGSAMFGVEIDGSLGGKGEFSLQGKKSISDIDNVSVFSIDANKVVNDIKANIKKGVSISGDTVKIGNVEVNLKEEIGKVVLKKVQQFVANKINQVSTEVGVNGENFEEFLRSENLINISLEDIKKKEAKIENLKSKISIDLQKIEENKRENFLEDKENIKIRMSSINTLLQKKVELRDKKIQEKIDKQKEKRKLLQEVLDDIKKIEKSFIKEKKSKETEKTNKAKEKSENESSYKASKEDKEQKSEEKEKTEKAKSEKSEKKSDLKSQTEKDEQKHSDLKSEKETKDKKLESLEDEQLFTEQEIDTLKKKIKLLKQENSTNIEAFYKRNQQVDEVLGLNKLYPNYFNTITNEVLVSHNDLLNDFIIDRNLYKNASKTEDKKIYLNQIIEKMKLIQEFYGKKQTNIQNIYDKYSKSKSKMGKADTSDVFELNLKKGKKNKNVNLNKTKVLIVYVLVDFAERIDNDFESLKNMIEDVQKHNIEDFKNLNIPEVNLREAIKGIIEGKSKNKVTKEDFKVDNLENLVKILNNIKFDKSIENLTKIWMSFGSFYNLLILLNNKVNLFIKKLEEVTNLKNKKDEEITQLQQLKDNKKIEASKREEKIEQLKKEIKELEVKLSEIEQMIKDKEAIITLLENDIEALKTKIKDLGGDIKDDESNMEKKDKEIKKLNSDMDKIDKDLDKLNKKKKEDIDKLVQEKLSKEGEKREKEDDLENLKSAEMDTKQQIMNKKQEADNKFQELEDTRDKNLREANKEKVGILLSIIGNIKEIKADSITII